jgi:probable F420-dependent oxidoreductase
VRFTAEITLADRCDPSTIGGSAIADLARAAEELGYDAISFNDHPIPSRKWLDAGGHDAHDPVAVHTYCAAVTERLRIIPFAFVLPYRNAFVVAKAFASLDVLSGGRAVAAVCVGYLRSEFAAAGVPFEERNDRFDEAITLMRTIWERRDEGLRFEGRFSQAHDQVATPGPVQRRLPLWICGNSARSRARVAQHGDGWAPLLMGPEAAATVRAPAIPTIADLDGHLREIRKDAEQAGRDPGAIEIQVGGGPCRHGRDDFAGHLDWIRQLDDVGVTQHVIDFQIGGARDGLSELRRFGENVVQRYT